MEAYEQALPRRDRRRRGAIYILVLAISMIVSVIGLSSMLVARVEQRAFEGTYDSVEARNYADSAMELALFAIDQDPNWRQTFTHDTPVADQPIGRGTLMWKLMDEVDSDLNNDPTQPVRIVASGTAGEATQKLSVLLEASAIGGSTEVGPQELRSYTSTSSASEDEVLGDKWWAQYFKPNLPAGATGWKVTSIEVYSKRGNVAEILDIRLYEPDASNMPSSTIVDEVNVAQSSLTSSYTWNEIFFSGHSGLDPTQGLCLALTTINKKTAMYFEYVSGGVSESDSGFIDGDPSWNDIATDKAFRYKIHGTYTIDSGSTTMLIVPGTWRQEVD